jgi:hypothetical protein
VLLARLQRLQQQLADAQRDAQEDPLPAAFVTFRCVTGWLQGNAAICSHIYCASAGQLNSACRSAAVGITNAKGVSRCCCWGCLSLLHVCYNGLPLCGESFAGRALR